MPEQVKKIVICSGEPAGIGPDIIIKAAQNQFSAQIAVIGDGDVLSNRAEQLGEKLNITEYQSGGETPVQTPGQIEIIPVNSSGDVVAGKLNAKNSDYVIKCIDQAVDLCVAGEFDAMVTAPVHKAIINDAGIPFTGHTEWIAQRCGSKQPVMMLANSAIRVCLVTNHLSLRQVPEQITRERLESVMEIMSHDLTRLYGFTNPKIGVCGLNPHAGEGGHLGKEEIEIITPAIETMQAKGFDVVGPIPADTAFTQSQLDQVDAVLAMYHDQGLPVIKHSGFGEVVNVTLGLPIIRTSVDHGTALEIAGTGLAKESSLGAAINLAIEFTKNQP